MEEKQRQQRRVDAQYAVSRVLEDSRDLAEAAPEIFRVFAERLGWEVGVLWTVEGDALRCGGSGARAGMADGFEETTRGSAFRAGCGLPGRVWEREEACWVDDVLEDEGFLRRKVAAAEGPALRPGLPDPGRRKARWRLRALQGRALLGRRRPAAGGAPRREPDRPVRRAPAGRGRARPRPRAREGRPAGGRGHPREHQRRLLRRRPRVALHLRQPSGESVVVQVTQGPVGKDVWEELSWVVDTDVQRELRRAMEEGETVGFETSSPETGDWILARAYPSSDGVSVYFQDITERKRVEEALRRARSGPGAFRDYGEGFCVSGGVRRRRQTARIIASWDQPGVRAPYRVARGDGEMDARARSRTTGALVLEIYGKVARNGRKRALRERGESAGRPLVRRLRLPTRRSGGPRRGRPSVFRT